MNSQEALTVLRKVFAYQPNQRMDELTAEAWSEALEPHDVRDALDAVRKLAVAPRQPGQPFWMEVRDIVQEVRHMERERLFRNRGNAQELESAIWNRCRDDQGREREELRALTEQLKSRDWTPPPPRAEVEAPRPVQSLVKQIGAIRNGGHPTRGGRTLTPYERSIAAQAWAEGREAEDDTNPYAATT